MTAEEKVAVLVVDDLPEKLVATEAILEDTGYEIVKAQSGREALRHLLERDFAVILLDVNMPDMDGFETAALIRQRKRSARTPIIFITAFADEMRAAQGYSLGAVDYILAPVVPEILRTKVRVFADLFQKTEQVKRQAEERVALAREQAARAAAEESTRRLSFLAEASTALASSLDYEATLRNLLHLVVPALGDLAAVTAVDEHGRPTQTELAWSEASGRSPTRALPGLPGLYPLLGEAVGQVLMAGKSQLLSAPIPAAGTGPPDFGLNSALVVPLRARGKTLGALASATGPAGRRYDAADLALAEELANRAAVAMDNARLYRDIQEGDRRKTEFLAMLAHELRNPLAPIRNAVQVMRLAGPDLPDLNWARDVLERQVQQLVRLVDDLLDVSRITRGKIRLQAEPVDARAVVERAVETSRPLIEGRRHEFTASLPPEPLWVKADPARLAQVLANLLNNAAKYTEEGGRVWLAAAREGAEVVFRVRDSGVGIPPEMLGHIFDPFTQVERSLDRSQGGLGIGLTLVHRLVAMHGGKVEAHSDGHGKGSEFVVRLPALGAGRPSEPSANGRRERPAEGKACRVLVVDDNRDVADSLVMILRMTGHEVRVAYDGPAALETVETYRPEIILLDIGLPGMDGYEVARRLRQHPRLPNALLVALSGYGQEEDRRRSREAGFHHHLTKPVEPEALGELFASLRSAQPQAVSGP